MKRAFHTLLVAILLLTINLKGQTVNFSATKYKGCIPLTTSFISTLPNASSYYWDFGNGMTSTSNNPTITFTLAGNYSVKLITTNTSGIQDTIVKTNYIQVNNPPNVNFNINLNQLCSSSSLVNFTNFSDSLNVFTWDFGDGNSSSDFSPSHTYSDTGVYLVKLLAVDSLGCTSARQANSPITITKSPLSDFTVSDSTSCTNNKLFSFTNYSQYASSWIWDFGDGNTSNLQNPFHQYNDTGTYSITLISLNNSGCSDTLTKVDKIRIFPKPTATFTSTNSVGCVPLQTRIIGDTLTPQLKHSWVFQLNKPQTGNDIVVTYNNRGKFAVQLVVENQYACKDTITKLEHIHAIQETKAAFSIDTLDKCTNRAIQFFNQSINGSQFHWDFGDSSYSTSTNPTHLYTQTGNFTVTLTSFDSAGCSNIASKQLVLSNFNARFSTSNLHGCKNIPISFEDETINSTSRLWNFGDGSTSTLKKPSHTYGYDGNFQVSLIVSNGSGCFDTTNTIVSITTDTIVNSINDTISGCLPLTVNFSQNNSGSRQWLWQFGNGDTSSSPTPSYTYMQAGTYTISLHTLGSDGCPEYIPNYATVVIDRIHPQINVNSFSCIDRTVHFIDSTTNILSWLWDFGDGTYSFLQNPIHQYNDTAVYNVSLTYTTSSGCTSSVFLPNYIDLANCTINGDTAASANGGTGTPDTAFTITDSSILNSHPCGPRLIQFKNPVDSATSFYWEFGDGTTSKLENPLHLYTNSGSYNVSLVVSNNSWTDTLQWSNYITLSSPTVNFSTSSLYSCDSINVQFNNLSPSGSKWVWKLDNITHDTSFNTTRTFIYSDTNHIMELSVVDTNGCKSSQFTILDFPINRTTFNIQDTVCFGDSILFSPSNHTYSYKWNFGDGNSSHKVAPKHSFSSTGSYAIDVTQIDTIGCPKTYVLDSILIMGAQAAFSISDSITCKNEALQFYPQRSDGDFYLWEFGNFLTDTSLSPSLILNKPGRHNVSLTISKDGCTHTSTYPKALMVKDINIDFLINQNTYCNPPTITVHDTSSLSNSWNWMIDTINIGGNTRSNSFSLQNTLSEISLIATTNNGCKDSISKDFTPQLITAQFNTNDTIGCTPFKASFTNTSTDYISAVWDFGDGDTSHQINPSHVYKIKGDYWVRLIVTGIGGCTDTIVSTSQIHVNSIAANYTESFNSSCAPMLANFQANTPSAVSWQWNFGDNSSSSLEAPMHIYTNSGHYNVTLVVIDTNGCSDTLSKKDNVFVPGPISRFTVSDTINCGKDSLHFTDFSTNAIQWNWSFGDGVMSVEQHPSHLFDNNGDFPVTLTTVDSNGCQGYYTFPKPIKVLKAPSANFSVESGTKCAPYDLHLKGNTLNVSNWSWDLGGSNIYNDSVIHHTYYKEGNYSISLRVENEIGCADSSSYNNLIVSENQRATITPISPLCKNGKITTLSATPASGKWIGNGITDSIQGHFNPSLVGIGSYPIIYDFDEECIINDTILIEIKESSQVNILTNETEICNNDSIHFQAVFKDSLTKDLDINYQWIANGKMFGTKAKVKERFEQGTYDIGLEAHLSNGCISKAFEPMLIHVFDTLPRPINASRVSVISDSEVLIEWEPNINNSFSHYLIYRKTSTDSLFDAISVIYDFSKNSFIDHGLATDNNVYCYKITSVDKCGNSIPVKDANMHCTINVSSSTIANNNIEVSWNSYVGCSINGYEIIRAVNDSSTYSVIGFVNSKELTYIDTTSYCSAYYHYKIRAIGTSDNKWYSLSDSSSSSSNGIAELQSSSITKVSVEQDESLLIEWYPIKKDFPVTTGYVLHKSINTIDYEPLTFLPIGVNHFLDHNVNVHEAQYLYKIEVLNSCPSEQILSEQGASILLNSTQINEFSGQLEWTLQKQHLKGIKHYQLQRLNEFNQWETIKTIPKNQRQLNVSF